MNPASPFSKPFPMMFHGEKEEEDEEEDEDAGSNTLHGMTSSWWQIIETEIKHSYVSEFHFKKGRNT